MRLRLKKTPCTLGGIKVLTVGLILAGGLTQIAGTSLFGESNLTKAVSVSDRQADKPAAISIPISGRQPMEKAATPTQQALTAAQAFPYATYDSLLWFGAEDGSGQPSWNDRVTGTPWTTEDRTADRLVTMWHPDTFRTISGDSSLWWGDPQIGGYASELYEALLSPRLFIPADRDSLFLIYKHHIRCEEAHGFGIFEGWDGYNVRIKVAGADSMYEEIAPYQVAADSSFYRHPPDPDNEWNILHCWEYHGEQEDPYGAPYDQWIGGFACDGTGDGGDETVASKIFDLRPFAGDTIQVAFVGGSDWGYDTIDDTTLFGFIIDDILVVEGLDSARLADLPAPLGGDTLFFDGFEGPDPGWERYLGHVPTGDWWWLAHGDALTEPCKLMCSDSVTAEFAQDLDNYIISPKIAHDDLADMRSLDLIWYLKGDPLGQELHGANEYKLDDDPWRTTDWLWHPIGTYLYNLEDIDNNSWWCVDQWSSWMHDMSPLVTDSTIIWDTLQVAIGVLTGPGMDTTGTVGLQVDHITLSGRIGAPYDIGVSAMKLPGPNANDVAVTINSVAITNYGFNVACSGCYQVFMVVLDTSRMAVFGPAQVLDFLHAPNVWPLETVMAPLDTTQSTFTLTEEMDHDIKVWTFWPSDTSVYNDTLKTPFSAKADHYPGFFNYPAGCGELRRHDQGFYTYPQIERRDMGAGDIAAVHFTPDESLYPFDLRLGLPEIKGIGETYNFKVWGSGNTPDEAPLLANIPFTTTTGDTLKYWRIELDTIDALQHLSSDFWMGVEFITETGDDVMGTESAENNQLGRNWGHSYLDTDTTTWEAYDYDWVISAVIGWRTVDPEIYKAKDDLHILWEPVSQAGQYYIYRQTQPDLGVPVLFDSTTASEYTDAGAVGDTTVQYYYRFRTIHQDGIAYDKLSREVGEFDRFLTNEP